MLRSSGHGLKRHRSVGRGASSQAGGGAPSAEPTVAPDAPLAGPAGASPGWSPAAAEAVEGDPVAAAAARAAAAAAFPAADVARIPEISAIDVPGPSELENRFAQRPRPLSDCVSTDRFSVENWRTIANASRFSDIDDLLSKRHGGRLSQTMLSSTLQGGESSSAKRRRQDLAHTVAREVRAGTMDIQQTSFSVSRSRSAHSFSLSFETWELEGYCCSSFWGCEECGRSYQSSP